ncbi:hypothetical protein ACP4OV_010990 [Aristida adscensionis]
MSHGIGRRWEAAVQLRRYAVGTTTASWSIGSAAWSCASSGSASSPASPLSPAPTSPPPSSTPSTSP